MMVLGPTSEAEQIVLPVVPANNVVVFGQTLQLRGDIYWVDVGHIVTIEADVALPDGEMNVMFDRVVTGDNVIADLRRTIFIRNGRLSLRVTFKQSGNYVLSAERLNEGLSKINAPFRVAFKRLEFDAVDTL